MEDKSSKDELLQTDSSTLPIVESNQRKLIMVQPMEIDMSIRTRQRAKDNDS